MANFLALIKSLYYHQLWAFSVDNDRAHIIYVKELHQLTNESTTEEKQDGVNSNQ